MTQLDVDAVFETIYCIQIIETKFAKYRFWYKKKLLAHPINWNHLQPTSFLNGQYLILHSIQNNIRIFNAYCIWRLFYCAGILEQSMGATNQIGIGLSYRPARLNRLAELISWNWFLGSFARNDPCPIFNLLQKDLILYSNCRPSNLHLWVTLSIKGITSSWGFLSEILLVISL